MKKETRKRTLARALVCGFILAAAASFLPFAAASEQLPQHVLRLHVVANSNSEADQAVKLQVRDAVLREAARLYAPTCSPLQRPPMKPCGKTAFL